ncbi:immunoglobulin domain-containing protein [Dyadobacter luteus]|nr:hypothetical protein [Dyadobacter luteus]
MRFISSIWLTVLMVMGVFADSLSAQPSGATYATAASPEAGGTTLLGYGTIGTPNDAVGNKPNNNSATLRADGLGRSAAILLSFTNERLATPAAPVTIYVRTDINALTHSNVISVVGFRATGTAITTNPFKNYSLADGTIFLAITLTESFKAVKITLNNTGTNDLVRIYYAFHSENATNTSNPYPFNAGDCGLPNVTTKEDAAVLLGRFTVNNPVNAIDGDTVTHSSFATNGLSLGNTKIRQTFFFNSYSNESDAVRIVISRSGSLVALNLATNIELKAYNGETLVSTTQLANDLLSADLLGLLNNDKRVTFYYYPKQTNGQAFIFDRLELSLNVAVLGVNLAANALNVHDVRRVPGAPSVPVTNTVCTNVGSILLTAASALEGVVNSLSFNWYTGLRGGNSLITNKQYTPTGMTATGSRTYYVDVTKPGCPLPSARHQVNLNVVNAPSTPPINLIP